MGYRSLHCGEDDGYDGNGDDVVTQLRINCSLEPAHVHYSYSMMKSFRSKWQIHRTFRIAKPKLTPHIRCQATQWRRMPSSRTFECLGTHAKQFALLTIRLHNTHFRLATVTKPCRAIPLWIVTGSSRRQPVSRLIEQFQRVVDLASRGRSLARDLFPVQTQPRMAAGVFMSSER